MRANHSANGPRRPTAWTSVNWRKVTRQVRTLRQRIFRASQAGDLKRARSLQKLMLRSDANTLLSVRRVTQLNAGRHTPGVDKLVVKTPEARGLLVDALTTCQPWHAKPVRRVYIPKANNRLRPLGIPCVLDRCLQAKVKNALEPWWEARFEGSSYGFRLGRSCHDAIGKITLLARSSSRKEWVVTMDITGAFDNLSHAALLHALGPCPGRALLRQWLKAGYLEQGTFHETPTGVPQGGVVSPVLLNVALHGMEAALGVKHDKRGQLKGARAVVRYADDAVVFCESREDAEQARLTLAHWLKARGLTLSVEKTQIVHLREGFDFLGFHIRRYPAPQTSRAGCRLRITPSKHAVQEIRKKLRVLWRQSLGSEVGAVLNVLNPHIRGWANYFRIVAASGTFRKLDTWMFQRALRYTKRTHPRKPWYWRKARYWGRLNRTRKDTWVFGDKRSGAYLLKFAWFRRRPHALVKGTASPDDPALRQYWEHRERYKAQLLPPSLHKLAAVQQGRCLVCGASLFNDEALHIHHRKPRRQGGGSGDSNLTLVHLYCHQQIHRGKVRTVKPADEGLQP
jgi:RNA-directed DNA polymerase